MVVPAIITPRAGKAMGKDTPFEVFAKGFGGRNFLACGGRPGRLTDQHWQVHAKFRSVRQCFGTAACARGGAGCKVWVWLPLAHPRASALGGP
jgi:hypothetical protein